MRLEATWKKNPPGLLLMTCAALLCIAGAYLLLTNIAKAVAATTVITPTTMDGWTIQRTGNASGSLVTGPATPPAGSGSMRLTVGSNGNDGVQVRNGSFSGTKLSDLTAFTYSTYVSSNNGCQAPYIILDVDTNHNGTPDDLLFFEPCYQNGTYTGATVPNQGNVTLNTWQQWNALTGGWWSLNAGNGGPPLTTLAQYAASHSGATIVNSGTSSGGIRIDAGFGAPSWNNFVGNFDNVTVGVKGTNTTYDFEPSGVVSCDKYAGSATNFSQGHRKDGGTIAPSRSNPNAALGSPDSGTGVQFVSLGFSGSITLHMNNPIINGLGNDVRIYEATLASNYPLEQAKVYASQNGSGWTLIGTANNSQNCNCTKNITDLDLGSLPSAQYIRIVDASNPAIFSNPADDGFDLNAVEALHNQCMASSSSSSQSSVSSSSLSSSSMSSSSSSSSVSSSSSSSVSSSSSSVSSSSSSVSSSLSSSSLSSSSLSSSSASSVMCTPNVSTSGLTGYWKFDEGSGSTTMDSSGNGHTGTLENGPTWTASGATQISPNPHALSFDGNNDQVRVSGTGAFAFGSGTSFTVSTFVKTTSGNRSVLGNFSSAHRGWGLYLYASNRVDFFAYGNLGTNDVSVPSSVNLLDNNWHNITGVFSRSGSSITIRSYVDGTLIGTSTATVGDITSNSSLLFGHYLGQPNFSGSLDEIRIYSRALSANEVLSLAGGCPASSSSSSSVSSVSSSSSSSSSSAAGGVPTCGGLSATIYVNAQGNVVGGPDNGMHYAGILRGTSRDDVMVGTNGPDMILGRSGNDVICGGGGNDFINGGDGSDRIAGEGGNDYITGGNGEDILCGGSGNDAIFGENAKDKLDGGGGQDMLFGGNGQDVCAQGSTNLSCEQIQTSPLPECNGLVSGTTGGSSASLSSMSSLSSQSSMSSASSMSSSLSSSSSSMSSVSSTSSSSSSMSSTSSASSNIG